MGCGGKLVKRPWIMMVLTGAVAASCAASLAVTATPAVGAVVQAGGWGKAIEVPGLARLSGGLGGVLAEVSCSSPGNCAAGGSYTSGASDHSQAFVVSENNGTWGTAIEVPGLAVLNTGGDAQFMSLSCGSAGNCAAGGSYTANGGTQAFVVSEKNGTWGKAMKVPGLAALSGATKGSYLSSVSCASAGNCTAGGNYPTTGYGQLFVVSEKNGTWGKAIEVPGLAARDAGAPVGISSIACASVGNCAVVGSYGVAPPLAFVISEKNGTWGRAIEVPGSAALGGVTLDTVSCASPGNCAAVGFLGDRYGLGPLGPVAVSEKNGIWGKAMSIPGTSTSSRDAAESVSCPSVGNCVAAGDEAAVIERPYQAFVASQKNGTWGKAMDVPGSVALNAGENADVMSVSCQSAGNCAAGGLYTQRSGHQQAFVVSENNGWWGNAIEVPGSAALNTGGYAQVMSVSCTSAGYCAAGGDYLVSPTNEEPFVVSRT
jgi:hypothetical protein